jgi:hypothetical protein
MGLRRAEHMSVKMRQLVEREIAHQVIVDLLKAGYRLGVNNGEETTIHHSKNVREIESELFTTDEDYILVYVKGTDPKDIRPDYWVRLIYGNDGWDVINDYSVHLEPVIGKGTATERLIEKYGD